MTITTLVLTVLGADKPGLVEQLAEVVAAHKANWLESSMSRLAGQFAGILRIELNGADRAALEAALQQLPDLQVAVVEGGAAEEYPIELMLSVTAHDRIGIVKEVTQVLARHGVNVDQLSTEVVPAPMSSEPLFQAGAVLRARAGFDVDALQRDLEALSDDLFVEFGSAD
ncbi:Glycine cleavage system regulatory protein [Andreprevotia lacus DSM 23236]|jgi:glycine cleavage system regulatory protein|uniref:Glycine cleavage system regulatory protein n=1 Tax=Andreprevotia lacus DSM 23236 TaxID=1121001 RepID=A0A1W1XBD0_9NEIS|nr:ACT domain-containing protein [Andreprevotia lacus]SMC21345.1 Glycine cleavage system regulatory protein [Andreprevotia lacus DSM 23236]